MGSFRSCQCCAAVSLIGLLPAAPGVGTGPGLSSSLTCNFLFGKRGACGPPLRLRSCRRSVCGGRIRPCDQSRAGAQAAGSQFRQQPIAKQRPYHVACDCNMRNGHCDMHCAIVTSPLVKWEYQLIRRLRLI